MSEGSAVRYWIVGRVPERELPLAGQHDTGGLPLAFVSCRDASVLLGNGLEGDPNTGFWSKQSLPVPLCN